MLAALGIIKGKPFNPDDQLRALLDKGAAPKGDFSSTFVHIGQRPRLLTARGAARGAESLNDVRPKRRSRNVRSRAAVEG